MTGRRPAPRAGIFISYRHADALPTRVCWRSTCAALPDAPVFIDLESIEAGLDFGKVISDAVNACGVMVVLIGIRWATLADQEGRRRLDHANDLCGSRSEPRSNAAYGLSPCSSTARNHHERRSCPRPPQAGPGSRPRDELRSPIPVRRGPAHEHHREDARAIAAIRSVLVTRASRRGSRATRLGWRRRSWRSEVTFRHDAVDVVGLVLHSGACPGPCRLRRPRAADASATTVSFAPRATSRTDIQVIVFRSGRIVPKRHTMTPAVGKSGPKRHTIMAPSTRAWACAPQPRRRRATSRGRRASGSRRSGSPRRCCPYRRPVRFSRERPRWSPRSGRPRRRRQRQRQPASQRDGKNSGITRMTPAAPRMPVVPSPANPRPKLCPFSGM